MKTALYRHWGGDTLLYVGISLNPFTRFQQHRHDSAWAEQVDRVTIEWLDTREGALKAERLAVKSEAPAFNKLLTHSSADGTRASAEAISEMLGTSIALIRKAARENDWERGVDRLYKLSDVNEWLLSHIVETSKEFAA